MRENFVVTEALVTGSYKTEVSIIAKVRKRWILDAVEVWHGGC
jgi:hypothetical protein